MSRWLWIGVGIAAMLLLIAVYFKGHSNGYNEAVVEKDLEISNLKLEWESENNRLEEEAKVIREKAAEASKSAEKKILAAEKNAEDRKQELSKMRRKINEMSSFACDFGPADSAFVMWFNETFRLAHPERTAGGGPGSAQERVPQTGSSQAGVLEGNPAVVSMDDLTACLRDLGHYMEALEGQIAAWKEWESKLPKQKGE